ncbi:MAG: 30S ribosomal protein S12 methylthiotransferase RimO [Oscillospiraceae bacterium]|jgi:ribosomal protein S12 methylthiotransferase|nr:30S ribosomal protein S12 methylthiotransferase RimO [Oscillospiraceae bacterium]
MQSTAKVGIVSLGCPKNQCDAELMLDKIAKAGFALVSEPGLADVVIINTCGFIQSAKEEAIAEIFEAISRKADGFNKKIIVTGCLPQRYREQMESEFPEVDGILGIGKNDDIVEAVNSVLLDKKICAFTEPEELNMEGERLLSTLPHYAYLRIADGCDNKCSYCAIPLIRGKYRSRKLENILVEARGLAAKGVRELIIISQDTTNYGSDLEGSYTLSELLNHLCGIDGIKWIRLLYCYPDKVTDELISTIKNQEKIVNYIEMPIQHCSEKILRAMNRSGNEQSLRDLIAKLRNEIRGIIIRTTVIAGFPEETEEQFTELAEFLNSVKFERLGCFAYSEEEDTEAAGFEQVDEKERLHRAEIINEQQEIRMSEFYAEQVGREFEVVVEGYDRYLEMYFGRSYMYAPEIDGMIYFRQSADDNIGETLKTSDFITVKITDVIDNNLIGEAV